MNRINLKNVFLATLVALLPWFKCWSACQLNWNVSKTFGWIAMKTGNTNSRPTQDCGNFADTSHQVALSGFALISKY